MGHLGHGWTRPLAPLLLLTLAAPTIADDAARVDFSYEGAAAMEGRFMGSCEGRGVLLDGVVSRAVQLHATGGTLTRRTVTVNETRVTAAGAAHSSEPRLDAQSREAGAGTLTVRWQGPDGLALILPTFGPEAGSFVATLDVERLNASAVLASHPTLAGHYWADYQGVVKLEAAAVPGWSRLVEWSGAATVSGDLFLYVRNASVAWDGAEFPPVAYRTERANTTSPVATLRTVEYRDAVLALRSVTFDLPRGSLLACGALAGEIDGTFAAGGADGEAVSGGSRVPFEDRVLGLEGRLQFTERPASLPLATGRTGAMQATATGDVRVIGLDFVVAQDASAVPVAAAAGALLLVAAWFLVKHAGTLVGLFYSRVGGSAALDHPTRRSIFEAVVAEPGVDLSGLSERAAVHLATIVYHVRVLGRVGLVSTRRHGRSVIVMPRTQANARDVPAILVRRDDRYAFLQDAVRAGPVPLGQLAEALRARFALTRRAAYRIVGRADRLGIVHRLESAQGVVVCGSPPS